MNGVVAALAPAAAIAALVILSEPLGPLRGTLLLVVALPPMAQTLAALGWSELLARRLAALGRPRPVLLAAYVAWPGGLGAAGPRRCRSAGRAGRAVTCAPWACIHR